MATAGRAQLPPREGPKSSSPLKTGYLIFYNFGSAMLWLVVLVRTLAVLGLMGRTDTVYKSTGEFTKWTQTLALAEIIHSLLGIVRSPVTTTAMQVASRFLLVWAIVDQFPDTTSTSPAYASMLIAWSVTEVIRYSYYVFALTGSVPSALAWLRYNTFYVLYPLGISSEMWLVLKAIPAAEKRASLLKYVLWVILGLYGPGSYILYTHMMAQRRRVMRGKQKARE